MGAKTGEDGASCLFMTVSLDPNRDLAARQAASGMSSDCFEPRSDQFARDYTGLKNLVTHPEHAAER
jgi:cytochrome oxidase Cu insertion factor (SCO1/SenC/PrrC family)